MYGQTGNTYGEDYDQENYPDYDKVGDKVGSKVNDKVNDTVNDTVNDKINDNVDDKDDDKADKNDDKHDKDKQSVKDGNSCMTATWSPMCLIMMLIGLLTGYGCPIP